MSVDTTTRVSSLLFNLATWSPGGTAWSGGANELAYDAFTHNLIFAEDTGNRVATFNLLTNTASVFTNLDSWATITSTVTGGTVVNKMDGGAFFYNDAYYFTVENADGSGSMSHSRFYKAAMNSGHTAFSSISLVSFGSGNPFLGDFGDMAITPAGLVYGSSTGSGAGVMNGFWKFDINNVGAGVTSINTSTTSAQLAFSSDYTTLFAHHFSGADFGTINLTTGVFTNNGALTGVSTGLYDLTAAVSPTPEPSSAVLLVLGVLLVLRRRSDFAMLRKTTR